jgi:phytoene dehydrogenase-like protein
MKVVIIGSGIAGLSAGCYLRMNGFETEIFEMHSRSGGLCTNWKQGGFTFNGCIHWLLGTNGSSPFFELWSELIDMSSLHFVNHDVRLEIETRKNRDRHGRNSFLLYTDLDRLERYMVEIAPEDEREIRKFIRQIRRIQKFEIPPMIKSVPGLLPWRKKILFIKYLPLLLFITRYRKITNYSFARKLKNPFLKEAFQLLFEGDDLPLLIHTFPLAYLDRKGAGYPTGGSSTFADQIEERYRSLGGLIRFNSPVEKILVENDAATGLQLKDGSCVAADFVISAADWRFTVFDALGGAYVDKEVLALGNLEKLKVFYSVFFVFLGLDRTFQDITWLYRFPLATPLASPDGTRYERMELHVHNYDPSLAPAGKSIVSVTLYTENGDFWIRLRNVDKPLYDNTKEALAAQIIEILDKKFGGIKEHIEQKNTATPASFHRYTNNQQGSIQGWMPGRKIARSPMKPQLPGLKNFYFAGHWMSPGGGLPVALKSARDTAMMICHKAGKEFTILPPASRNHNNYATGAGTSEPYPQAH